MECGDRRKHSIDLEEGTTWWKKGDAVLQVAPECKALRPFLVLDSSLRIHSQDKDLTSSSLKKAMDLALHSQQEEAK